MTERIFDYTTLDLFLQCRKKYYWRMVRHLNPKTVGPALEFGKAIHLALESYYRDGLDAALNAFSESYKDREGEELRTVANGLKLIKEYARVYQIEPFKVLDLEIGFVVPVESEIGAIMYAGRLDGIIEWDKQIFVLEHKTTTLLRSNFFKQFHPNMQIDGYTYATSVYTGKKCHGVVVNALEPWKEVKRATEKTKHPENHFARDVSSRSDNELKDFALQANQIVRDILLCEERMEFYQNKKTCFSYNYECPYKQLCLYGDDERLLNRDYTIEKWEPYKEKENDKA